MFVEHLFWCLAQNGTESLCKVPFSLVLLMLVIADGALSSSPHQQHSSISQNMTLSTSFQTKDYSELGKESSKINRKTCHLSLMKISEKMDS